jgi:TonB family protein
VRVPERVERGREDRRARAARTRGDLFDVGLSTRDRDRIYRRRLTRSAFASTVLAAFLVIGASTDGTSSLLRERLSLPGPRNDAPRVQAPSAGTEPSDATDTGAPPGRRTIELVDLEIRDEASLVPQERIEEPATNPGTAGTQRGRASPALRLSYTSPEYTLLKFVEPYYPTDARALGLEGRVIVHTLVGSDGRVRVMRPEPAPSLPESFAVSAQWAIRQWEFAPLVRNGEPRSFWIDVPVRFRIDIGVDTDPS